MPTYAPDKPAVAPPDSPTDTPVRGEAQMRPGGVQTPARPGAGAAASADGRPPPELPAPLRSGRARARGWRRWSAPAAVVWALVYGGWHTSWALGNAPSFEPFGSDLLVFSGWAAVGLCVAAAAVSAGLGTARGRSLPLLVAAGAVSVALVVNCPLLLLDVVGVLLPGLGLPFDPAAFASRAACLAAGLLVGAAALTYRGRWWGARAGRTRGDAAQRLARTPGWARLGAYAAVAGCGVRVLAQYAVGFDAAPLQGGTSLLVFDAGFVLAGTVLPLALVRPWGRTFPRWVPLLAGRRVPRWLVLGPALGISGALTVYFGVGTVQLLVETVSGAAQGDNLPRAFYWVAMPAYTVWGVGLGAAAVAYYRATEPS